MANPQKNKGLAAERDLIKLLQPHFPDHELSRNYAQNAKSGYDILGLEPVCIEVKRAKTASISKWWAETLSKVDSAGDDNSIPVLAYKLDHRPWLFLMPVFDGFVEDHKMIPVLHMPLFVALTKGVLKHVNSTVD